MHLTEKNHSVLLNADFLVQSEDFWTAGHPASDSFLPSAKDLALIMALQKRKMGGISQTPSL